MKIAKLALVLALPLLLGCSDSRPLWHDQLLPSGKTVKVTSFFLVWGVEHDERRPGDDSFAMEFVSPDPNAGMPAREQEALEVFELMRPVSELWGFDSASIARFPSLQRKGAYDLFLFHRGADGKWSVTHERRKVFAND